MINIFGQQTNRRGDVLGCEGCSLNNIHGLNKIKGLDRIKGRRAFLWAQSPGARENEKKLELVGPAGTLLWKVLESVNLKRTDFDLQNILRCRPLDPDGIKEHLPTKQELLSCSVYNDEALELNHGKAVVHLILGDVAGNQLLGKTFKKDTPVLWYEPWDAYVVLNWHPSYILRQGGEKAGWEYLTWRERMRAVRAILDHPGRWGYIKSLGYKTVRTHSQFDEMEKVLRSEQARKRRCSVDVEDGIVDGKKVLLMTGFGTGHYQDKKDLTSWTGKCFSVVLDHPQSGYTPRHAQEMKERVKKLIEDGLLKKSLQNGSYDKDSFKQHLDASLKGYDYDTQTGTYLRYSFLKSCGLEPLTYRFFPEFGDYKETVSEWQDNFANAPIDRLTLRNSGDCDITQRLEQRFSPRVPYPLMQVYIYAGLTLAKMERRGPILDWPSWKKAMEIVPKMSENLDRQLAHISGESNFNVESPPQVAYLIYDTLGFDELPDRGRSTNKTVLEQFMVETNHPAMELITKRRAIGKIEGTYLKGFAKSAKLHEDELRTIWWLTGAVTGRLRSGKGDRGDAEGIVNLQNLHGNPLLQNMLVSDREWRRALGE